MSVPPVTRSSFFMRDGDSLNDYTLPYQAQNGVLGEILSAQIVPVGASYRRMNQINYATSGNTTVQMEGRKTNAALNAITHYMGQGGINDIQLGIPLGPGAGSSINNVQSIMTYMSGRGIGGWWIGLWCLGELYPAGANPQDAQIAAWEAAIAPIVNATPGFVYVPIRPTWSAGEAALNVPGPPGVSSGILCVPAAAPPFGIHFNPTGNRLITPVLRAAVTVV